MNRAPLVVGQRDDGGTLQTRQHIDDLLQTSLGGIHANVLLVLSIFHSLETEEHLVEDHAFVGRELLVADEQSLAPHDNFHLAQIVADEGRARRDDIEDTISQSDARADLYRTRDDMNFCLDAFLI